MAKGIMEAQTQAIVQVVTAIIETAIMGTHLMERSSTTSVTTMVPATMEAVCVKIPSVAPAAASTTVSMPTAVYCRLMLSVLITLICVHAAVEVIKSVVCSGGSCLPTIPVLSHHFYCPHTIPYVY